MELAKKEQTQPTHGERFTQKVLAEFNGNVAGGLAISEYQRKLIQGYFIAIDQCLNTAEERRRRDLKNEYKKYKEQLPVAWENVNLTALATDIVRIARLGLDAAQKNHINFIPYKNNALNKYDVGFITGYVGLEYIAKKYAQEMPLGVICELVYSNDTFKPIKRSLQNKFESYEFEISNPFERGNVIGAFAYFMYPNPEQNRLLIMSLKDIEKRKPAYASPEFWGGEKDKYENGKKVGKEKVDGWYDEMCLKTIKRAAYGSIPLDPQKVDENYQHLKQRENQLAEMEAQAEISQNANGEIIDVEHTIAVSGAGDPEGEVGGQGNGQAVTGDRSTPPPPSAGAQMTMGAEPGF